MDHGPQHSPWQLFQYGNKLPYLEHKPQFWRAISWGKGAFGMHVNIVLNVHVKRGINLLLVMSSSVTSALVTAVT